MTSERDSELFEAISQEIDERLQLVGAALADPEAEIFWSEQATRVRKVLGAVREAGAEHELLDLLREQLQACVHDVLTIIDGGTALAEQFRIAIVDDEGRVIGNDDLHERFVDHLFDTGRRR